MKYLCEINGFVSDNSYFYEQYGCKLNRFIYKDIEKIIISYLVTLILYNIK